MNIMKKIGVFITSLFLVLSISATSSFADGHGKTILFSIKGPGSGNPFWASVEKGAKEEAKKLSLSSSSFLSSFNYEYSLQNTLVKVKARNAYLEHG